MIDLLNESVGSHAETDGASGGRRRFDGGAHVVVLRGELDLMSRSEVVLACTSTCHLDVIVDMANVAFMDCAGYGGLVAAQSCLERRGGSLALMNLGGEPLRLLSLIRDGGPHAGTVARYATSSVSFDSVELP